MPLHVVTSLRLLGGSWQPGEVAKKIMQKYCNKNATIHFKQIMAASKARQPAVVNSASKCQSNLPDKLLEAVFQSLPLWVLLGFQTRSIMINNVWVRRWMMIMTVMATMTKMVGDDQQWKRQWLDESSDCTACM